LCIFIFVDELFKKERSLKREIDRDFVSALCCSMGVFENKKKISIFFSAIRMLTWQINVVAVKNFFVEILYTKEYEIEDPKELQVKQKIFYFTQFIFFKQNELEKFLLRATSSS
jgi:hypothetical protein